MASTIPGGGLIVASLSESQLVEGDCEVNFRSLSVWQRGFKSNLPFHSISDLHIFTHLDSEPDSK